MDDKDSEVAGQKDGQLCGLTKGGLLTFLREFVGVGE